MTNRGHKASSYLKRTQSAFTMSAMISGAMSDMGVFRLTLKVNGYYQWDILLYTVLSNLNCYKTSRWRQFCFQQDNALAHHACNPVKVQGREILSSLLLIMAFSLTAQQWSPLIMRFRDSYIRTSRSCKLTRFKSISSDWLKFREVGYRISLKRCDLCVFLFHKVVQRHY